MNNAIDAIDELVARSKDHKELRAFHQLHREHPEVLDHLVSEVQLLIENGHPAFSFALLVHYSRWKLVMKARALALRTYLLNDHATPFYARAIIVLHPEFNGFAEFRKSIADEVFGTRIEPLQDKRASYARRNWTVRTWTKCSRTKRAAKTEAPAAPSGSRLSP